MITLADIEAARARVRGAIFESPCAYSENFSLLSGNRIFFKLENLQMTGSFKERGALNRILTLTDEERARGVIAASAGNHAQAVAWHAARQGIRAVIYMPLTTPLIKVSSTRAHGAEVVLHGANYDEAYEEARRRCDADRLTFVHPFDDDAVIAGQGTMGLEIVEQVPDVDAVAVPIGGGGMIAGIGCAVKEKRPGVKIIGVQTERLPSMRVALADGKPVTLPPQQTIADGIAVRRAGERPLPLVAKYVDEIVTVDEEEIASAILLLLEREKTVAEGAGAAAVAALVRRKVSISNKNVVVVVGGGNIDVNFLARIIERGLVKDGRLVRVRVHMPDFPGALHKLTGLIADQRANIREIGHDRAYYGVSLGQTIVDATVDTRGPEHVQELFDALAGAGYRWERVL